MRSSRKMWYLLALLMIVLSFWYLSIRNRLTLLADSVESSWDPLYVQLQHRYAGLNTLSTHIQAHSHDDNLNPFFTLVSQNYTQFINANTAPEKIKISTQLEAALNVLLDHTRHTPPLATNPTITQIRYTLQKDRHRLLLDAKRYNDNAEIYNLTSLKFPYSAVIRLKHHVSSYPQVIIYK